LKQRLATLQEATVPSPDDGAVNKDRSNPSEEEHHDLAGRFSELTKKYRDMSQKVKYLVRKNATVMQKNKDMKESVRAWQEYADRQFGKQKSKSETRGEDGKSHVAATHLLPEERPHVPSSPGSAATVRTPGALANLERSSPASMVPLSRSVAGTTNRLVSPTSVGGDEGQSPTANVTPKAGARLEDVQPPQHQGDNGAGLGLSSHVQRIILDHEGTRSAIPSSSQTTVDEPAEPRSIFEQAMDADDDDVPEFVSERSLKRKRDQPSKSKFEIYADHSSDGTPIKPHRVKEEPQSSPPVSVFKMTHNETMDLDDPTPYGLKTPRHPRTRLSYDADTTEAPHQPQSNNAPLTHTIKNENLNDADLLDLYTEMGDPQATGSVEARAFSEPAGPTQAQNAVLRSLDPNVVSSASEEPPNKRSRQAQAYHQPKHDFLAESGEAPPPNDDEPRLPPRAARAQMNQRLQALKNLQTPGKTSPKTPKSGSVKIKTEQVPTPPASSSRTTHTPSSSKGSRSSKLKTRGDTREEPTPEGPVWTMKAPETRCSARKRRTSPSKQEVRLRDKPVDELSVKDFKPNPEYNQGYSYAFSETVRKRADRMCLPGCTNPQCCGSTFRAFAEAQPPLSASQEETLLEDYLGDAYSHMQLTQMASEEREELVLQARTKKMAKESGKHREAYERRRTPPGFWRVDFPTTQEQHEDRQRAKEQEKAIVRERWLEAHRRGGRWIFRDE
jgi:FtsZ-binding cell division protein ZapB